MANPIYSTLQVADTLLAQAGNQTVVQFNMDRAYDGLNRMLAAHNSILAEITNDLAEVGTESMRMYGTPASMEMVETDEMGRADSQGTVPGTNVGFPLRKYDIALQWTFDYMEEATMQEIIGQSTAAMDADARLIPRAMRKALFTPTDYTSRDRFVRNLQTILLPVKALANADGAALPPGPNGETFNGSSHTHYLTCITPGTPVAADFIAGVNTVAEHFNEGKLYIYINRADEAVVRGLAGFTAATYQGILQPTTVASIPGMALDPVRLYNRFIGIFQGAEVWTKFWIPAGYPLFWMQGPEKLLYKRLPTTGRDALVLQQDSRDYPLIAKEFNRKVGFGVWNRVGGAILDLTNGSYTTPSTINQ